MITPLYRTVSMHHWRGVFVRTGVPNAIHVRSSPRCLRRPPQEGWTHVPKVTAVYFSTNEEPKKATESTATITNTSTSTPTPTPQGTSVYVHPLSQIVLQHFQEKFHPFLTKTGLDRGLSINDDGTFVLRFPCSTSTTTAGSTEEKAEESNRIWTSYESEERKHWLTVKKGEVVGRFLLQDNMKPAWHSSASSTPVKVQNAVDELVAKLEQDLKKDTGS